MDAAWLGVDASSDSRRWIRDLSALLALPALWVDHQPAEIATGLLSVLFSILRLDGGYARFDDPGGGPLELWRPSGAQLPAELQSVLRSGPSDEPGIRVTEAAGTHGPVRVASVPLALPWETGLVLVSAGRSDFPTQMEAHLLGVAVGQAAIAVHTARRLAAANAARAAAEATVLRQNGALRALVDEVDPTLRTITHRIRETARLAAEIEAAEASRPHRFVELAARPPLQVVEGDADRSAPPRLTQREIEVLGLLAQGLSNKEIAGVMWLSYRTVERHVTSLYRKIGVARRSEATAFALRQGVV